VSASQVDATTPVLDHITAARWFAGKGRRAELVSVTPLPWVAQPGPDGPGVRFEIAEVRYPDDSGPDAEWYQLALAYRTEPAADLQHAFIAERSDDAYGTLSAYDAMQDRAALRQVLAALLAERTEVGATGSFGFHLSSTQGLSPDLEPVVYAGQQSNTSVMFGDTAMVKFFRRLELGRNLDIEVHRALNEAGVADVAGLYGWMEGTWVVDGEPRTADLAMAVEKLADAEDGWALALDSLASGTGFTEHAHALGAALAEIHRALGEAFPTGEQTGSEVAAVMASRLERATGTAPELRPYEPGLRGVFDALAGRHLPTQRVHGDFHLGQTLHTPAGWKIIDFEGEPAKSLAERVVPDSVCRDLAGMLRSIDYAAASVPGQASAGWARDCRKAFLAGYASVGAGSAGSSQVSDGAVLDAYEADKAVYEVVYEARNRPDWVGIPLAAVAVLATTNQAKE
jgi:maltokinase